MSNARLWLFRFLVLIGIAGLAVTWVLPWWTSYIEGNMFGTHTVAVHPTGLDGGGMEGYFAEMPQGGSEVAMPVWFTPAMWVFFGLLILALLAALWYSNRNKQVGLLGKKFNLSSLILSLGGVAYTFLVILAIVIAWVRVTALTIPFIGESYVNLGEYKLWYIEFVAHSNIRFAYWLALATGLFLVLLAFLRNKLVSR
jgi:hypothetical protein